MGIYRSDRRGDKSAMVTTRDTAKLLDLKKRVESMSPGDRLRLCAGLIDEGGEGNFAIAETLASNVVDELRFVRIMRGRQ
jgi:hypothetical protein